MAEQPQIHELKPQPTAEKAVAAAKAHVDAVHQAAGNAQSRGAGATIIAPGKGK